MTKGLATAAAAVIACTAALLTACGSAEKATPPPAAAAQQPPMTQEQSRAVADAEQQTNGGAVGIDDEILRLCPSVKPAYFAYDSASVRDRFRNTVSAIADCMNNGALKGRKLMLVGHADPRGEPDYNLALGGRRADSVRQAIKAFGARPDAMDVSSRGEVDATGTDAPTWAKDRRVDIKLQPGSS